MYPPVKTVVPQAKQKIFLGGCQNVSPSDKDRKKLNVSYRPTCSLGVYGLNIVSGAKEVKDIASFFILNPLETVMAF